MDYDFIKYYFQVLHLLTHDNLVLFTTEAVGYLTEAQRIEIEGVTV